MLPLGMRIRYHTYINRVGRMAGENSSITEDYETNWRMKDGWNKC